MTDLKIEQAQNGWDLVLENGDLVLETDDTRLVAQRVIYRLMTWLRESPYDRSAGVPYVDGVFGLQPVEAVVFILTQEMLDTDGVEEVVGEPTYLLDSGRQLSITATLRVAGDETVPIALEVAT